VSVQQPDLRVMIVDDEPLIRAGLRAVLNAADGLTVVGEAADGAEAVSMARQRHPDVAVVDVRMPRVDGIEATRQLKRLQPAPAVLVVTTFDLDEYVYAALHAGASGFLLKDAPEARLVAAVQTICAGSSLLDPRVTLRLVERLCPPVPTARSTKLDSLTARERDVLIEVAQGATNLDIARTLGIGEATVKTHISHILAKLDLATRVQAVVMAYETGLVGLKN